MSYRITSTSKKLLKYYKDEFDTVGKFLLACGIGSLGAWILAGNIYWSFHESVFFEIIEGGFGIQFSAKLTGNFFLRAGISAEKKNFHEDHQNFSFLFGKKNVRDNCARETGQKITYSLLNLKKLVQGVSLLILTKTSEWKAEVHHWILCLTRVG